MMEGKDGSRANPGLLALIWENKQMDSWTDGQNPPQVTLGPSLGCSHVDDHKALDIRELRADEVHLQLPWATFGGGNVELDQGPLLRLQAGHPGGRSRGKADSQSLCFSLACLALHFRSSVPTALLLSSFSHFSPLARLLSSPPWCWPQHTLHFPPWP